MNCPYCGHDQSDRMGKKNVVIDSRDVSWGNVIRRRRACPKCERRWSTEETIVRLENYEEYHSEEFVGHA